MLYAFVITLNGFVFNKCMTTLFSAYLHVPCMKQACDHNIYLRYIYSVFINFLVALQMVFNDFILFIDLSYLLLIEY